MTNLSNLSKRERAIAIAVVAAGVLWLLNITVVSPFLDQRNALQDNVRQLGNTITEYNLLFAKHRDLQKVWETMQSHGLQTDASDAETQAWHAAVDWTRVSGLDLNALRPDRNSQQDPFQIIGFRVQATGSMRNTANLLWAFETAKIPVRINDVTIIPQREGIDNLQINIGLSTLSLIRGAEKKPAGNTSGGTGSAADTRGGQS